MLKKLITAIASCILLGLLLVSCQTAEPEEKSIDIYMIAGQSNAAGYTKCDENALAELWSEYNSGTSNVLYYGSAEYTYKDNNSEVLIGVNKFSEWVPARAGMGWRMDRIGPEVGIAAYLSENCYYDTEESKRTAGLIKFAHGGSSLFEAEDSDYEISGSWASPSYIAEASIKDTELTGKLYRGLISEVENGVASLRELGYTDINIKGVFWMQGETDKNSPDEYKRAFEYFVDDLRHDIGEVMQEDLATLPIMVGEISETSGSAFEETVVINKAFVEMQRGLPGDIDNVYIIKSGQYKINRLEGSFSLNHGDSWHWNTSDMFAIGQMVGECIVVDILKEDKH